MSTGDAQIEPNKNEVQHGGPKTQEGKDVSRLNATTHGLTSKIVALFANTDDLTSVVAKLKDDISFTGPMVDILVERVAVAHARMKKTDEIVGLLLENESDTVDFESLEKFYRYHTATENRLYRAIREYKEFMATKLPKF